LFTSKYEVKEYGKFVLNEGQKMPGVVFRFKNIVGRELVMFWVVSEIHPDNMIFLMSVGTYESWYQTKKADRDAWIWDHRIHLDDADANFG
jgi:hypothetical protein